MGGDQLRGVFRPGQVTDLAAGVNTLHGLTCQGVPEPRKQCDHEILILRDHRVYIPDISVSCSSARGQEAMMMRRPGDGLDSGYMVAVGLQWREVIRYVNDVYSKR